MHVDPAKYVHLPFFVPLGDEVAEALAPHLRLHHVRRRGVIFRQGDPSDPCHILVSGKVKIASTSMSGDEAIIDVLMPGDLFGIAGVVGDLPRVSNATAMEACEVLSLPCAVLKDTVFRYPSAFEKLLHQLIRRLTLSIQQQVIQGTQRVYARLAMKMLTLSRLDDRLPAGLSHQDLASMIGSTRATVTRILQDMRRQGCVEERDGAIVVASVEKLLELAGNEALPFESSPTVLP